MLLKREPILSSARMIASLFEFTVGTTVAGVKVSIGGGLVIAKVGNKLLFTKIILSATVANSVILSVVMATSICCTLVGSAGMKNLRNIFPFCAEPISMLSRSFMHLTKN